MAEKEHPAQNPSALPEKLQDFLNQALETIKDENSINLTLEHSNVSEDVVAKLKVQQLVQLPNNVHTANDALNLDKAGNFPVQLVMFSAIENGKPVAVTAQQLSAIRNGDELHTEGFILNLDYRSHPNFLRMLAIFPEFTSNLVAKLSQNAASHGTKAIIGDYKGFENEIFVAHELMLRLIDAHDPGVYIDGELNQNYMIT